MTKLTYSEQLKHPKWQRKRLEILEAADWKCIRCSSAEKTLHVHHRQYIAGRLPWEYAADDLLALCEDCHAGEHGKESIPNRRAVTRRDRALWLGIEVADPRAVLSQVDWEFLCRLPPPYGFAFVQIDIIQRGLGPLSKIELLAEMRKKRPQISDEPAVPNVLDVVQGLIQVQPGVDVGRDLALAVKWLMRDEVNDQLRALISVGETARGGELRDLVARQRLLNQELAP